MDSLFFRDGRPMNMGESAWVDSQFPPTGQTMQGAIRAAILDSLDADIHRFQNGENCLPDGGSLREEIGDASSLGALKLVGPFIAKDGQLFFPAPLDLVKNRQGEFGLLTPSDKAVFSDLGTIRYPAISGNGYKTQEDNYISCQNLEKLLRNETDDLELIPLLAASGIDNGLADREPKIGLARDNETRSSKEGYLFAIAPVRPRTDVTIVVGVKGVASKHHPPDHFLQKVGGEGKLARITTNSSWSLPAPCLNRSNDRIRFRIVFLTPALPDEDFLIPDNVAMQLKNPLEPVPLWQGQINGCLLAVITGCIGKPSKIGGWNLKEHRSKPLRSFIPAGSVLFCEAEADQKTAILSLHNQTIGKDTEYGFGHILIGKWKDTGAQS